MSVIKKYSYLRALLIGVPFGIGALIVGIRTFGDLKNIEDFTKVESYISKIEIVELKEGDRVYNLAELTLKDGIKFYSGESKEEIINYFSDKSYVKLPVKIWHEEGEKYIKQLLVNDTLLFEYKPPYWIAHFFLWLGIVTLTSALIYVIKHPEDLTGKKKS